MGSKAVTPVKGKATPAELVKAAQIEDRIKRARPPKEDRTGACAAMLTDLSEQSGVPFVDLYEEWAERAAVRQYMGATDQREAERLAVEDVRARLGVAA